MLYPDHTLNVQAYNDYSPLYLALNYAATYLLSFALCTCMLVHTALYHGPSLIKGMKRAKMEDEDIHSKLMRYYPEVPDWWYAAVFCLFFVFGLLAILVCFSFPIVVFFGGRVINFLWIWSVASYSIVVPYWRTDLVVVFCYGIPVVVCVAVGLHLCI